MTYDAPGFKIAQRGPLSAASGSTSHRLCPMQAKFDVTRPEIHNASRKKVPKARGPSPAGIFAVTASVSASIAQTSFENQLTT
jgi:hypothetical protein